MKRAMPLKIVELALTYTSVIENGIEHTKLRLEGIANWFQTGNTKGLLARQANQWHLKHGGEFENVH